MPTEDELLQRIAAAAIPRKLGHLYSRYGQPAPVLGDEPMPAPQLGRDRPHADGAAGRPESQQREPAETERMMRERFSKYEDQPDSRDQSAALAEQGEGGMSEDDRNSLVNEHGQTTEGLEDLMDSDPTLTPGDVRVFVDDHAKSGIGWEDWLDQRKAEMSGPDQ